LPSVPGYDVLAELGRGGMGIVYRARHRQLKRVVALKMVLTGPCAKTDAFRFAREAESAAKLQHPHIIQIYEVGLFAGRPFLALEFVDGPNLSEVCEGNPWPPASAARLVSQLARAMHYAHQRGIIHRDLKPDNILLGREDGDWMPKIADFGLAKDLNGGPSQTRSGIIIGTPAYMAPEQASGQKNAVGPSADIYALGGILYEMLTGRPPFEAETAWEMIVKVATEPPTPPRALRPEIPEALQAICLRALAKCPSERQPTAADLAEELDRCMTDVTIRTPVVFVPRRTFRIPWRRIRKPLLALLVGMVIVGVLAIGMAAWQRREAESALSMGEKQIEARDYAGANRTLTDAVNAAYRWPVPAGSVPMLENRLRQAQRGQAAADLHRLAERLRFLFDPASLSAAQRQELAGHCRKLWDARLRITAVGDYPLVADDEARIRTDLLDVAIFCAELLCPNARTGPEADRQAAQQILAEAETLSPGPLLTWHRHRLSGEPLEHPEEAIDPFSLGRSLFREGRYDDAASELERAVDRAPRGFWANFYRGVCAHRRGREDEALASLSVCVALAPDCAECYHNRAIVHEALAQPDRALRDYDRALELAPQLAGAALNRGLLHGRLDHLAQADNDLMTALAAGAPPAAVYYNLAILHRDHRDANGAAAYARHALDNDPHHAGARELLQRLSGK
jgi:tetratricopeptide (TPR) repeat protein/tRNA A-37 threonylcarbamoyl transferase component Bud32